MPFTYTVDAFRSTTANGLSISTPIMVLGGIFVVFLVLNLAVIYIKSDKQQEETISNNSLSTDKNQSSNNNKEAVA